MDLTYKTRAMDIFEGVCAYYAFSGIRARFRELNPLMVTSSLLDYVGFATVDRIDRTIRARRPDPWQG